MVAASVELNHLLAARACLPPLGFCDAHEFFDILILRTETVMLLLFARNASLVGTFHTGGYVCDDVDRPHPVGARTVAAIGAIQHFEFFPFSDKSREDLLGQKRDAMDDWDDLGTTTGREV